MLRGAIWADIVSGVWFSVESESATLLREDWPGATWSTWWYLASCLGSLVECSIGS